MLWHAHLLTAAALLSVHVWFLQNASPLPGRENEDELLTRLQREGNPVKRAKLETRLGRIKLGQAIGASEQGNFEQCQQLLAVYLERMKSSWETLRKSGRRAVRQPQGFKELDIALREDSRRLEDLKRRIPYDERGPVERTAQEIDRIRDEVLHALFPRQGRSQAAEIIAAAEKSYF